MSQVLKKSLQEGYNRLKKALKKTFPGKQQNSYPQLILQPYRNKRWNIDHHSNFLYYV